MRDSREASSTERPPLPQVDFQTIGPAVGTRFPDVSLPDQHGELVDLHRYRAGRPALFVVHRSAEW